MVQPVSREPAVGQVERLFLASLPMADPSLEREETPVKQPLDLVRLTALMELSKGRPQTVIGLVDGPIAMSHPDLSENVREIAGDLDSKCTRADSIACLHGTFTAGILSARRESPAPGICPECTLLVRPIFKESPTENVVMPSTTPGQLAAAIVGCVYGGVHVLNLSVALVEPSSRGESELKEALDLAAQSGVVVVAAAGNQGTLGSSAITRHSWVISVAACDLRGRPIAESNLGNSIGRRGLMAPGDSLTSLGAKGEPLTLGGTSVAAPFVTGAIALLWSLFPSAKAVEVISAVTASAGANRRRTKIVPPLLDAWAAYQALAATHARR